MAPATWDYFLLFFFSFALGCAVVAPSVVAVEVCVADSAGVAGSAAVAGVAGVAGVAEAPVAGSAGVAGCAGVAGVAGVAPPGVRVGGAAVAALASASVAAARMSLTVIRMSFLVGNRDCPVAELRRRETVPA